MKIVQNLVDKSKYNIKCPYPMTATRYVVHETANDASAKNEIAYMIRNNNTTSFHFAVDDTEVVQGIPLDRNAFHAGDGDGKGNREGIAVEICYSKSGGEKWRKAVDNAAQFIAQGLKERGWGIDKVTKHQDYSGKKCPHRILSDYGWTNFLNLVSAYLNPPKQTTTTTTTTTNTTITKGCTVKVKSGAKDYNGKKVASFIYNNTYTVDEIKGDRAVLGKKSICTAFNVKDLTLVKAGTTTTTTTVASTPKVNYFTKYTGTSGSIVTALNSLKITSSFSYRSKIAKANGIKLYVGTAAQNTTMLKLLKQGKLVKP